MNSLCALKSYKNQIFITQVTYYCILCFYRTILTVFLFGVRGFATGFFQAISLYAPEVTERPDRVCSYIRSCIHSLFTGLPYYCESLWYFIVLCVHPYWINDCSIYCPGL